MGIEIQDNRMFCNTADVLFGPEFETHEDVEAFITWVYKTKKLDPRSITTFGLTVCKKQWEAEQQKPTSYVVKSDTFDQLHIDHED